MVKHQKEKLYQSAREHRKNSRLRTGDRPRGDASSVRRLPFDCCALTLTPFRNPVCLANGVPFENDAVTPYLLKHGRDPVTGDPATTRDLVTLRMDQDPETGKWRCPVTCKAFTDHSRVVAVRVTGDDGRRREANVYSLDAVEELNYKAKNWTDLTSGAAFTRADVMTIADPRDEQHVRLRDINNFQHTEALRREHRRSERESQDTEDGGGDGGNVRRSLTAARIMEKLTKTTEERKRAEEERQKKKRSAQTATGDDAAGRSRRKILTEDVSAGVELSAGLCSGSFTSTSVQITNTNVSREATAEEILAARFAAMKKMKKKGYVRLVTNVGDLDVELHCDVTPRTTANFLGLAKAGRYNGSSFHRSVPKFMIQGGKPSKKLDKKDRKDRSVWGEEPFRDEFDDRLKHSERGVLSMANTGPHTNRCQFFVTFAACPHLDRKHSVFGKLIRGDEILDAMEKVPTDGEDAPTSKLRIKGVIVLVDPAAEAEESERIRIEARVTERERRETARRTGALGKDDDGRDARTKRSKRSKKDDQRTNDTSSSTPTIGRYLPKHLLRDVGSNDATTAVPDDDDDDEPTTNLAHRLPPAPTKTTFGDFDGW